MQDILHINKSVATTKYWLSPVEIHPQRVIAVFCLWKQANLRTTLAILSRMINVRYYEETRGQEIGDDTFMNIAKSQTEMCKEKESEMGRPLDIDSIQYSTPMLALPFLFFVPITEEGISFHNAGYKKDGTPISIKPPLGIVSETKDGRNITRDLDEEERRLVGA